MSSAPQKRRRQDTVELRLDAPTVLLVARGERFADALETYLNRHAIQVETAPPDGVTGAAFVMAPDLIVLAGEAARDKASAVLAALAANPMTATMPVAMISSDTDTLRALGDLRQGLVAVVPRSASADEMARRIAELARDVPEREGQAKGELETGHVSELVSLLDASLRSGVLTLKDEKGKSAQLLLHAGRSREELVSNLIEQLRQLSDQPGGVQYELEESASPSIPAIAGGGPPPYGAIVDRRLILIERDPARADILAQALRTAGAHVVVVGENPQSLELARELLPDVVIVDGDDAQKWAADTLRAIRRDPWLRWASVVVVDSNRVWRDAREPDLAPIERSVVGLMLPDAQLSKRAASQERLAARLETIGPFRLLRALGDEGGFRVRVQHPRIAIEVDLADGLVAGARAIRDNDDEEPREGIQALTTLFSLSRGRVEVKRVEAPRSASIMAPLDVAARLAATEAPMIKPSLPPPSLAPPKKDESSRPSMPSSKRIHDLVNTLEGFLERLEPALAPGAGASLGVPTHAVVDASTPSPAAPTAAAKKSPSGYLPPPPSAAEEPVVEAEAEVEVEPEPEPPAPVPKVPPPKRRPPPISTPNVPAAAPPAVVSPEPPAVAALSASETASGDRDDTPPLAMTAPEPELREAAREPESAKPSSKRMWVGVAAIGGLAFVVTIAAVILGGETPSTPASEDPTASEESDPDSPTAAADPVRGEAGAPPREASGSRRGAGPEEPPDEETADETPAEEIGRIAADAPIEGDPSDLDLSALGVEPVGRQMSPAQRAQIALRLVREGNSFRRRGRMDLAEARYVAALGYDPENGRAIGGLAGIYGRRGDDDMKLRLAQHLCRARPTSFNNYLFLGDVFRDRGDLGAARRAYEQAAELAPRSRGPRQRLRALEAAQ